MFVEKSNSPKYIIRPPLVIFFKNEEKITSVSSSPNFLSQNSDGQDYYLLALTLPEIIQMAKVLR